MPFELLRYKSATQCRRKISPAHLPCTLWSEYYARVAESFARRGLRAIRTEMVSIFKTAEDQTGLSACPKCNELAKAWTEYAQEMLQHPKYTDFDISPRVVKQERLVITR